MVDWIVGIAAKKHWGSYCRLTGLLLVVVLLKKMPVRPHNGRCSLQGSQGQEWHSVDDERSGLLGADCPGFVKAVAGEHFTMCFGVKPVGVIFQLYYKSLPVSFDFCKKLARSAVASYEDKFFASIIGSKYFLISFLFFCA